MFCVKKSKKDLWNPEVLRLPFFLSSFPSQSQSHPHPYPHRSFLPSFLRRKERENSKKKIAIVYAFSITTKQHPSNLSYVCDYFIIYRMCVMERSNTGPLHSLLLYRGYRIHAYIHAIRPSILRRYYRRVWDGAIQVALLRTNIATSNVCSRSFPLYSNHPVYAPATSLPNPHLPLLPSP